MPITMYCTANNVLYYPTARDALEGGGGNPPPPQLYGTQPVPSHCPPDGKCQPQ